MKSTRNLVIPKELIEFKQTFEGLADGEACENSNLERKKMSSSLGAQGRHGEVYSRNGGIIRKQLWFCGVLGVRLYC